MRATPARRFAVALALCALASRGAYAGSHTWKVNEVFSNADGTIQFIELREWGGGTGEIAIANHHLASNLNSYLIPSNLVAPTSFKSLLFATPAFASLPGAPAPDFIFPASSVPFFSIAGGADTFRYIPIDAWSVPAGMIPLDGYLSLNRDGEEMPNSPTNYAGDTATIDLRPSPPPAVPDGRVAGTTPMTVIPLDTQATSLRIHFDTTSCNGDAGFHIVYGSKSDLPAGPAGSFDVSGGQCAITGSPYTWNLVPAPNDGLGLLWFLVLANDGATTEGSWGLNSAGTQRIGPMPDGSSGVCGITQKVLTNTCGN